MNKVIILGRLGQDPELKYTTTGRAVCNLSVATSETWTDKNGVKQERTEWHRIVVWGATAENCAKYLSKGRQVMLEGKLQTRNYEDKDNITRYVTEIVADSVQFIGGTATNERPLTKAKISPSKPSRQATHTQGRVEPEINYSMEFNTDFADEDIPF